MLDDYRTLQNGQAYSQNIRGLAKYESCDRLGISYVYTDGIVSTGAWPLAETYKEISDDYLKVYSTDGYVDVTGDPATVDRAKDAGHTSAQQIQNMGELCFKAFDLLLISSQLLSQKQTFSRLFAINEQIKRLRYGVQLC